MKIGYSKTYPLLSSGCYEKIWLEDDIDIETFNIEEIKQYQYRLKKAVENFHYESNKASEKSLQTVKEEPQSQEAKIIAQIYSCKELKVLESYKLIAKNNESIQAAYNQQYEKLHQIDIQKQVNE
jgi:methionine synthase I (cobalamin-dependent)